MKTLRNQGFFYFPSQFLLITFYNFLEKSDPKPDPKIKTPPFYLNSRKLRNRPGFGAVSSFADF